MIIGLQPVSMIFDYDTKLLVDLLANRRQEMWEQEIIADIKKDMEESLKPASQTLNGLLVVLEYHEAAAREGKEDYAAMCDEGDGTYLCETLLSLVEQHEKFAAILRAAIDN